MTSNNKLNILVIMSDQHNHKITGCYGDTAVRTPNIDGLAAGGMRFSNTYCPAPICVPSRMSFMSGRRPHENRVMDNFDILSSRIITWPEKLKGAGYHTALIGRMHFEGPDQFHGFETTLEELRHWRGNKPVRNQEESVRVPNGSYWSPRESVEDLSGKGTTFVQFRDETVTDSGCSFLRREAERGERPFAAVIGLYNPHPPYVGKKDLFDYYYKKIDVPDEDLSLMPGYLKNFYSTYRNWENPGPINPEAKRRARAAYYANCEHMDQQAGRILRTLNETGLAENTLVIYTSDHGDMLGKFGAWGKGSLYEDSARVPMIVSLPGVVPAGSVCGAAVNLRDLGNTFCEIAGAPKLNKSDAPSLWPYIQGKTPDGSEETESELYQRAGSFGGRDDALFKMVRRGPWKCWCYRIGEEMHFSLYNIEKDPEERNDLISDPDCSQTAEELKNRLLLNWDSARIMEDARERMTDRAELDRSWHTYWLHAGYPVPRDLDSDV
ncbi:MAG: sulfatase-like hydrolase/transferase [Spirochaetia bacterium]